MTEGIDLALPEPLPPADAFDVLAHETRLGIVRELYEAGGRDGPGRLGYADLMDAVGIEDSGKFNYHLSKLRGRYVKETDAGYGLRRAGAQLYRVVATELYRNPIEGTTLSLDGACALCDGGLELRYDGEWASVACGDCGNRATGIPLPPTSVDGRPRNRLLRAVDRRVRQWNAAVAGEICVHCGGDLDGGVYRQADVPVELPTAIAVAMHECRHCGAMFFGRIGGLLLTVPAVIGFFADRGIDATERYHWRFPFVQADDYLTVVDADPLTLAATIQRDGEDLRLRIERDLSVERIGG